MKEITLGLTAMEENGEDCWEFGVEIEVEDNTNVHKLIHIILREGIKAAEKEGIKIVDPMFRSLA